MRLFHLVSALILFGSTETARAVDYVQCEAMRAVYIRLDTQRKNAVEAARYAACKDLEASSVPIGKYVECMKGLPTDIQPNPTRWPDKVEDEYKRQINAVVSDMEKAKCLFY